MNIKENFEEQKMMIEWLMEKGNLHFNQAICIVALMETNVPLSIAWTQYMFPETNEINGCKAALHGTFTSRCCK